jgi:hypothetical protein
MNVALIVIGEPSVDVVAIDLSDVLEGGMAIAVDDRAHKFLRRVLQTHLPIEPIGSALLKQSTVAAFSGVDVNLFTVSEFLIGTERNPIRLPAEGILARAAPDERAAAVAKTCVVKYVSVIVNKRAVQQLI